MRGRERGGRGREEGKEDRGRWQQKGGEEVRRMKEREEKRVKYKKLLKEFLFSLFSQSSSGRCLHGA